MSIDDTCRGRRQTRVPARMTRVEIRGLKRSIRGSTDTATTEEAADQARASAISLLERSVQLRHKRLAVIRFALAIQTGASISSAQREYCEKALAILNDGKLRQMVYDASKGTLIT